MRKLLVGLLALGSISGFAKCFDLEKPLSSLSVPGIRGVMAILPYEATKVCVSYSNGFMGGPNDVTWRVELKDSDGYTAARFHQDKRPDGNVSRVSTGRCFSYCKTIVVDSGQYFNVSEESKIYSVYFPLNITVKQTAQGSNTAKVEFSIND